MIEYWIFFAINPQIKLLKSINDDEPGSDILNNLDKQNGPTQNSGADEVYYAHFQILYGSFYNE